MNLFLGGGNGGATHLGGGAVVTEVFLDCLINGYVFLDFVIGGSVGKAGLIVGHHGLFHILQQEIGVQSGYADFLFAFYFDGVKNMIEGLFGAAFLTFAGDGHTDLLKAADVDIHTGFGILGLVLGDVELLQIDLVAYVVVVLDDVLAVGAFQISQLLFKLKGTEGAPAEEKYASHTEITDDIKDYLDGLDEVAQQDEYDHTAEADGEIGDQLFDTGACFRGRFDGIQQKVLDKVSCLLFLVRHCFVLLCFVYLS